MNNIKLFDLKKLAIGCVIIGFSGCELEKLFVATELRNINVSDVVEQKIKSLGEKISESCVVVADTDKSLYVCYSKTNILVFARYLKEKRLLTADDYLENKDTNSPYYELAVSHKLVTSKIESFFSALEKPTHQNRLLSYDEVKSFRSGW